MAENHMRKKIINEREYTLFRLPPLKAIPYALKIYKMLLPFLQGMGLENKDGSSAISIQGLASLDTDTLFSIIYEAIECNVKCDGKAIGDSHAFDVHFQKYPEDFFQVAVFVIKENCWDFLKGAASVLSNVL
jgi:hypothetical protein